MSRTKIIFMGTAAFAVPSLDILLQHSYEIAGVITAPDKPAGRGQKLSESPVKQYAKEKGLNILQPVNLKSEKFINELKSLNADLQIVVAFRMLPEQVWSMPALGTINLHSSLLPQYRGAAPINWAIINGEKETGVTTFFIKQEIDTGNIIFQEPVKIGDNETAGELHDRLMLVGANLVLHTVQGIESGTYLTLPQRETGNLKTAAKIFKEDCKINWQNNISDIYNFIRGLSPYPAAWTILDNKVFKIYKAEKEKKHHNEPAGTILSDQKKYVKVAVNGGYLDLKEVQLEGKRKISIEEFLRGYRMDSLKFKV